MTNDANSEYIRMIDAKVRISRENYDEAYFQLVSHLKECDSNGFCHICAEKYERCDKAASSMKTAYYYE
jgi:hypothetical protein